MPLQYVPLLEIQRDLYRLPRDRNRFRTYLRTMMNDAGDDIAIPPLVAMNPMAREHVPQLVEAYLALDADQVAHQALAEIAPTTSKIEEDLRIGLVVLDDLHGGWTNRYAAEYKIRFATCRDNAKAKERGKFLLGALWSSEPPEAEMVRHAILLAAWQWVYRQQNGPPRTIREMLLQAGFCLAKTCTAAPAREAERLASTRARIAPHLDACDMPTAIACLYGDEAAESLGFACLGLEPRAGFELALHDSNDPRHL